MENDPEPIKDERHECLFIPENRPDKIDEPLIRTRRRFVIRSHRLSPHSVVLIHPKHNR